MSEQTELPITGAASALKYLENSVKQGQQRLDEANEVLNLALQLARDKPMELDGENFEQAVTRARAEKKDAEDSLLKFSKIMLDYDKSVDTSRRDVSEKISKAEAEKILTTFAIVMRGGVEQLSSRQAQDAMECKSSEEMYQITNPLLRECFGNALDSAVASEQLPDWVRAAVLNAL
jgi:hypothetical protein